MQFFQVVMLIRAIQHRLRLPILRVELVKMAISDTVLC